MLKALFTTFFYSLLEIQVLFSYEDSVATRKLVKLQYHNKRLKVEQLRWEGIFSQCLTLP